jgi:alpha/beta hydrolase fold
VTGSSSFVGFLCAWITEYAHPKSAVIVMPNYRLLPEARGRDILDDMNDFWAWVTGGKLQAVVNSLEESKGVEIDLERIWAHGESVGMYFLPSFLPHRFLVASSAIRNAHLNANQS